MMITPRWLARLAGGVLFVCWPALAAAQGYAYPERGQSPMKQEADYNACSRWAVQQSGFDPADPWMAAHPPPPDKSVVGSGALARGAAGGAALGALGGAIGGDAGKGAAIGAGVGAVFGGIRRRNQIEQEQHAYQSQTAHRQSAVASAHANYDRAFAACMAGRGYHVR